MNQCSWLPFSTPLGVYNPNKSLIFIFFKIKHPSNHCVLIDNLLLFQLVEFNRSLGIHWQFPRKELLEYVPVGWILSWGKIFHEYAFFLHSSGCKLGVTEIRLVCLLVVQGEHEVHPLWATVGDLVESNAHNINHLFIWSRLDYYLQATVWQE